MAQARAEVVVGEGRGWQSEARAAHGGSLMTMARFTVALIVATILIEALLAFRAWVQLSGWQLDIGALRALYDVSTALIEPFRGLETTSPIRQNDILELATMVAFEAYLVLAVLVFGAGLLVRALSRVISLRFEHDGMVLAHKPAGRQVA